MAEYLAHLGPVGFGLALLAAGAAVLAIWQLLERIVWPRVPEGVRRWLDQPDMGPDDDELAERIREALRAETVDGPACGVVEIPPGHVLTYCSPTVYLVLAADDALPGAPVLTDAEEAALARLDAEMGQ